MKRSLFITAALFITVSFAAQAQSSSMLSTIKSYYEGNGDIPQTARFMFYRNYAGMSDPFTAGMGGVFMPENVKVVARTDRKNAYEVTFTINDEKGDVILLCKNEKGKMKVDNVMYGSETCFNYSNPSQIAFSLDMMSIEDLVKDFVWSINVNGKKEIITFDIDEKGNVTGTGYIQNSSYPAVRTYKGSETKEDVIVMNIKVDEYTLGSFVRSFEINTSDDLGGLVMKTNGQSYPMTMVEPRIK